MTRDLPERQTVIRHHSEQLRPYIYVVHLEGGSLKIGSTYDPKARIPAIRREYLQKIVEVVLFDPPVNEWNYRRFETAIHHKLAPYKADILFRGRRCRELFNTDIERAIRTIKKMGGKKVFRKTC